MKKYGLLILLVVSFGVRAHDGRRACLELNIIVENRTSVSCYLTNTVIEGGFYAQGYPIPPNKLAPGESYSGIFQQQSNYYGSAVSLNYECGQGEVVFRSQKEPCVQGGAIVGTLTTVSNMNATYEVSLGNFWQQIRGKIHWTLSDN